jgi:transposase-like protein
MGGLIQAVSGRVSEVPRACRTATPLAISERAELAELRRRTRELEQENLFLKKAAAYVCPEH